MLIRLSVLCERPATYLAQPGRMFTPSRHGLIRDSSKYVFSAIPLLRSIRRIAPRAALGFRGARPVRRVSGLAFLHPMLHLPAGVPDPARDPAVDARSRGGSEGPCGVPARCRAAARR